MFGTVHMFRKPPAIACQEQLINVNGQVSHRNCDGEVQSDWMYIQFCSTIAKAQAAEL